MPAEENKNRRASFMEIMKNRILSGELKPGDRLPPERALVRRLTADIAPRLEAALPAGDLTGVFPG